MDACLQTYAQKLDFLARRLISPLQQLENHTKQLKQLQSRLVFAMQQQLQKHQQTFLRLKNSIEQLSPQAVLARGYAMVFDESGKIIKDAQKLTVNQSVNIKFGHGEANAEISDIR